MRYSQTYRPLSKMLYSPVSRMNDPAVSDIHISWCRFDSAFSLVLGPSPEDSHAIFDDNRENQFSNSHFIYPVISAGKRIDPDSAIVLLHGLNERSWDKYLPWAATLSRQTGASVILFPIAYHMNRSPVSWRTPRQMKEYVSQRLVANSTTKQLSVANVALSERLSLHPERFFLSGYQAATDVIQLCQTLKAGIHPLFGKHVKINFFAYSIGVLLSQVLLFADPRGLFAESKFFFFCGGSTFEGMQGISKFILDDLAFRRIIDYYIHVEKEPTAQSGIFYDLFTESSLGKAFQLLISKTAKADERKTRFSNLSEQIRSVCLTKDSVVPCNEIKSTMQGTQIEELDFTYPYLHENPFPVFNDERGKLVDEAFKHVMSKASVFLGKI